MTRIRRIFLPIGFMALTVVSSIRMSQLYASPFPHFDQLVLKFTGLQDLFMILAGFRSTAADLAWVELLQYTGGGYTGDAKKKIPAELAFETIKDRTLRVTRINPFFTRAYVYGGSILAWFRNVDRPQEAVEVLSEGIHYNPDYWPLHTYIAAIAYKKAGKVEFMTELLEQAVKHPECPTVMKTVLANTYKKMGRYSDALEIWEYIAAHDVNIYERRRAFEEIPQILTLIRSTAQDAPHARR